MVFNFSRATIKVTKDKEKDKKKDKEKEKDKAAGKSIIWIVFPYIRIWKWPLSEEKGQNWWGRKCHWRGGQEWSWR